MDVAPAVQQGDLEEAEDPGDEQAHTMQPVKGDALPAFMIY